VIAAGFLNCQVRSCVFASESQIEQGCSKYDLFETEESKATPHQFIWKNPVPGLEEFTKKTLHAFHSWERARVEEGDKLKSDPKTGPTMDSRTMNRILLAKCPPPAEAFELAARFPDFAYPGTSKSLIRSLFRPGCIQCYGTLLSPNPSTRVYDYLALHGNRIKLWMNEIEASALQHNWTEPDALLIHSPELTTLHPPPREALDYASRFRAEIRDPWRTMLLEIPSVEIIQI
jgi:hypothetical protein